MNRDEMIEDNHSIGDYRGLFATMIGRIDDLVTSVNDYKNSTSVELTRHTEKIISNEGKIESSEKDLLKIRESLKKLDDESKDTRHLLRNVENQATYFDEEIKKLDRDMNDGIESVRTSLIELHKNMEASKNREKGESDTKKSQMKVILIIATLAATIVGTIATTGMYIIARNNVQVESK